MQLAGLARLPASSLHWGSAAGQTDSLIVADVKLAEVVQKVKVVVLLQLGLWANTLEHLESERRLWRGEEAWGGQRDNDRLLEGDPTYTHFCYKRAAAVIGLDVKKRIYHLCNMKN